jgi:hypothetical protein
VWLTQVGDARQFQDFASFRSAVLANPVQVTPLPANRDLPGGFDVAYESPIEGGVGFGTTGPLTIKGMNVALDSGMRYDNPWAHAAFDAPKVTIADTAGSLELDFENGERRARPTHP